MILVSGFICSSFNYRSSHKKVSSKFHDPPWNSKFAVENQCLESMKGGQKTYFQRRTCCLFQISVFCSTNFELQKSASKPSGRCRKFLFERKMMSIRKSPWVLERRPQHKDDPPIFDGVPNVQILCTRRARYYKWPVIASKKVAFSLVCLGL